MKNYLWIIKLNGPPRIDVPIPRKTFPSNFKWWQSRFIENTCNAISYNFFLTKHQHVTKHSFSALSGKPEKIAITLKYEIKQNSFHVKRKMFSVTATNRRACNNFSKNSFRLLIIPYLIFFLSNSQPKKTLSTFLLNNIHFQFSLRIS